MLRPIKQEDINSNILCHRITDYKIFYPGDQSDRAHKTECQQIDAFAESVNLLTFKLTLLRKAGVDVYTNFIVFFYKSRILSQNDEDRLDEDRLENFQSMCIGVIMPYEDGYTQTLFLET